MVDFEQKRWAGIDREEDHRGGEMDQYHAEMQRERQAWEHSARQEVLTGVVVDSASSKLGLSMTPLVK